MKKKKYKKKFPGLKYKKMENALSWKKKTFNQFFVRKMFL